MSKIFSIFKANQIVDKWDNLTRAKYVDRDIWVLSSLQTHDRT